MYILSKGSTAPQSAAAAFAAKEAALKALGVGIGVLSLSDVAVRHAPSGKPYYAFSAKAQRMMAEIGAADMHLSISHEGNNAVAFAILEGTL